jgi:hypothetical protein
MIATITGQASPSVASRSRGIVRVFNLESIQSLPRWERQLFVERWIASPGLASALSPVSRAHRGFKWNYARIRHPAPLDCSYFSNIVVKFCGSTEVSISGVQNRQCPVPPPPLLPLALPRSRISHPFLQSRLPGRFRTPRTLAFPHLRRRTRGHSLGKRSEQISPCSGPSYGERDRDLAGPRRGKYHSKTSHVLQASVRGSTHRIFHFQQFDQCANLHGPGEHTHCYRDGRR